MVSKLLMWDFDGTLAYREGMWSGALHRVLCGHHPETRLTIEEFRPYMRTGFPWHRPEEPHSHLAHADEWWADLHPLFAAAYRALGVEPQDAEQLARRVRSTYCDPAGWSVFPEVPEVLSALQRDGWTHVILSNHVPELEELVVALGLRPMFAEVFTSATIGHEKPSPAAFNHVLSSVGTPEQIWMIGDNPIADVAGAAAVGIPGILVRASDPQASHCCTDLTGVPALLRRG